MKVNGYNFRENEILRIYRFGIYTSEIKKIKKKKREKKNEVVKLIN